MLHTVASENGRETNELDSRINKAISTTVSQLKKFILYLANGTFLFLSTKLALYSAVFHPSLLHGKQEVDQRPQRLQVCEIRVLKQLVA